MDPLNLAAAILVGSLVGLATGLVPGLHVNTLAALLLVTADPGLGLGLIAIGTVHTVVSILPATYLGAPSEDTALATLPAHRMLLDGRGPDAVRISVHASLGALLLAVACTLPLKWLLAEPGRLLQPLDAATPWLLLAVVLLLVVLDRSPLAALLVAALAASLGMVAWGFPVRGILGAGSPLLPLLSGLFGLPTLLHAARGAGWIPHQHAAATAYRSRRDVAGGTLAASVTAVLPGLTAAVATALARPGIRGDDPRPVVATLSAVNTAHMALALAAWWTLGRSRSGLGLVSASLLPAPVPGGEVVGWLPVAATMLGAGALAALGTLWLDARIAPRIHRVPAHHMARVGIVVVVAINVFVAGALGVALLAVATWVGTVPLRLGVRRVHLAASLLVPIAVTRLA